VLHPEQALVVLPDDSALGEFREAWRGVFGMLEERPAETDDRAVLFAGARRVASAKALYRRIDRSPEDRVDETAFLTARLTDILVGDRDRHRDQFRWATFSEKTPRIWVPISRDHDEAFVKLDGPVLAIVRLYIPPLVSFGENYPANINLNWHAREVDRRLLTALGRSTWDSVARNLQSKMTDSVIDNAVRLLPPEMYKVGGADLARTLKVRRNKLVAEALGYYDFLAGEVQVHATDAAEVATITRVDDRFVDLAIRQSSQRVAPHYHRRFDAHETHEIRLNMWGGKDSVIVQGGGKAPIRLRVIGGGAGDVFIDSSRIAGVKWYDDSGSTTVSGPRSAGVNTKHYTEWVGSDENRYPPRDWGTWWRPVPWLSWSGDLGLVAGVGVRRTEYGFRRDPFASDMQLRVAYATTPATFHTDFNGDFHPENTRWHWNVNAYASGIVMIHYFGQGNNSFSSGNTAFYRVDQQQYAFQPSFVFPLAHRLDVSVGPVVRWSHTGNNAGNFLGTVQDTTYGAGDFGQVGARAAFQFETRDRPANAHDGVYIRGEGRFYPAVWDVKSAFGWIEGEAGSSFSAKVWSRPTLALRAGARKMFGPYPFQESAFIGGRSTVPGFSHQRFAGDGSLYGSVGLRFTLVRTYFVLPAMWGVYGGTSAGRVYLDSESPGGWHTSIGGGIWVAFLDRANTFSAGFNSSSERSTFYAAVGFTF
jgi:hypothetical protein